MKPLEPDVMPPESDRSSASEMIGMDAITRGEIDMQIATAKRYPRDIGRVVKNMVAMATVDEGTAEGCFYTLSRRGEGGSKAVQGPSIRLAEIALSCFGNVRAATRGLGETDDGRFVRELGICHDVENNVMVAREVRRRITTKEGKRYGDDMVGTTMAAAGSIALRNAILTVVPRAIVKSAYDAAKSVALGKTKSLSVRRGEIFDRLKKLGHEITDARILAQAGKGSIAQVDWDDLDVLIGLGTAIKDGVLTVEAAFPDPSKEDPSTPLSDIGVADVLGENAEQGSAETTAGEAADDNGELFPRQPKIAKDQPG